MRMWPFSDLSLSQASTIGTIANWALLVSLIVGVIATRVIVVTADIKEDHWDKDREISRQRIAELNNEASKARLETENIKQVVSWRNLGAEARSILIAKLSSKPGSINLRYSDGDPEALYFMLQINEALQKAHWSTAPGSAKINGLMFGMTLVDSSNPGGSEVEEALKAAAVDFQVGDFPRTGPMLQFNVSTIPGAPMLFVGPRVPPALP